MQTSRRPPASRSLASPGPARTAVTLPLKRSTCGDRKHPPEGVPGDTPANADQPSRATASSMAPRDRTAPRCDIPTGVAPTMLPTHDSSLLSSAPLPSTACRSTTRTRRRGRSALCRSRTTGRAVTVPTTALTVPRCSKSAPGAAGGGHARRTGEPPGCRARAVTEGPFLPDAPHRTRVAARKAVGRPAQWATRSCRLPGSSGGALDSGALLESAAAEGRRFAGTTAWKLAADCPAVRAPCRSRWLSALGANERPRRSQRPVRSRSTCRPATRGHRHFATRDRPFANRDSPGAG